MRLAVLSLVVTIALGCPALAEGAKPAKPAAPGTSVDMPFLIAPMSKDGKLLGYSYISSKLVCSSGPATVAVREKLAFIQDANVRDVNTRSVSLADDPEKVDQEALALRLADNARNFVGASKIVRLVFIQVQFAPLHPSQSTLGMLTPEEKADATAKTAAAKDNPAAAQPAQVPPATSAKPAATSKPPSGK